MHTLLRIGHHCIVARHEEDTKIAEGSEYGCIQCGNIPRDVRHQHKRSRHQEGLYYHQQYEMIGRQSATTLRRGATTQVSATNPWDAQEDHIAY